MLLVLVSCLCVQSSPVTLRRLNVSRCKDEVAQVRATGGMYHLSLVRSAVYHPSPAFTLPRNSKLLPAFTANSCTYK